MKVTDELKEAVKEVLIDMAIDDELPMDMTTLDIDTVFDRAIDKVKQDKDYVLDQEVKELCSKYIMNPFDEAKEIWKNLNSMDDNDMSGDHFDMVQAFETSFTIADLAEIVKQ